MKVSIFQPTIMSSLIGQSECFHKHVWTVAHTGEMLADVDRVSF